MSRLRPGPRFEAFIPPPGSVVVFPADYVFPNRAAIRLPNGRFKEIGASTTAGIQEAIDVLPTGGGAVYLSPGTYSISAGSLVKKNKTCIYGFGRAFIQATVSEIRIISTNDFHDCIFDGLIADGSGSDTGTSSGRGAFHITNSSLRCIIQNCQVYDASGSGIVDDGQESKIINNHIERTVEHGIYMSSSLRAVISGNLIIDAGTIASSMARPVSGIKCDGASYCSVLGNVIRNTKDQGITMTGPAFRNTFNGNVVLGSTENDIYFGTGNETVFDGNIIDSSASGFDAVLIVGGKLNVISDNYIRKTAGSSSGIRWNTAGALGQDLCEGNLIIADGAFTMPAGIHVDSASANDIQIKNNSIFKVGSASLSNGVQVDSVSSGYVFGNITNATNKVSGNGTFNSDATINTLNVGIGPKLLSGSGTPEGSIAAPVGSIYSRTDGGASTSIYVKESGTGNTGWVAK